MRRKRKKERNKQTIKKTEIAIENEKREEKEILQFLNRKRLQ